MARVPKADPYDVPACPQCGGRIFVSGSTEYYKEWHCTAPGCDHHFGERNTGKSDPRGKNAAYRGPYDRDSLIEVLRDWNAAYGQYPTTGDLDAAPDHPHSSTYTKKFGSFTDALRLARERDADGGAD